MSRKDAFSVHVTRKIASRLEFSLLARKWLRHVIASRCERFYVAEREGFEPSNPLWGLRDFESRAFDHSAISPGRV